MEITVLGRHLYIESGPRTYQIWDPPAVARCNRKLWQYEGILLQSVYNCFTKIYNCYKKNLLLAIYRCHSKHVCWFHEVMFLRWLRVWYIPICCASQWLWSQLMVCCVLCLGNACHINSYYAGGILFTLTVEYERGIWVNESRDTTTTWKTMVVHENQYARRRMLELTINIPHFQGREGLSSDHLESLYQMVSTVISLIMVSTTRDY